ncbi:MAG: acyl-CoA dehydrogenase family protein [Gammaproteobacteria bacterium]|nr:acyl-CoA dehydrogenase family protein [Gammaproteobacteria bacterium]
MSEQAALFDLTLTEEQRITREVMKKFSELRLRAISRDADEAGEAPEGFYNSTMELGLSLIPIPEKAGGAGMPRSPVANMLNAEDLGKGDMSLALGTLTPLAFINTVIDNGTLAQQEAFLSPLVSEEFVPATIALMEPLATFEPTDLQTKAAKSGDSYVLNGVKNTVILGDTAEQILVIAEENGIAAGYIVPAGTEGLSVENEKNMGLHAVNTSKVTLDNVTVPAINKLGSEEQPFDLQRLLDLSRLGICAMSLGCAEAMLEYVTEYVNERVAFGEPISHRQSVAFMVANIVIELESMRLMVYRAAARAEQGLDFHREAYLAQVICAEKAMEIGNNGVQLLGGHGFIREHMVELWYRNLRSVGVLEGAACI